MLRAGGGQQVPVPGGGRRALRDVGYPSLADYSASSGHLINHAAAPGVEYRDCRHPRFGHVLCVLTVRDIARGEELFVKVTSHNIT